MVSSVGFNASPAFGLLKAKAEPQAPVQQRSLLSKGYHSAKGLGEGAVAGYALKKLLHHGAEGNPIRFGFWSAVALATGKASVKDILGAFVKKS